MGSRMLPKQAGRKLYLGKHIEQIQQQISVSSAQPSPQSLKPTIVLGFKSRMQA